VAQAPWTGLCWAGSWTRTQDQHVRRKTLGGGNDLLLRPASRSQIRNLGGGQSGGKPLMPRFKKPCRPQIVRFGEALLYRGAGTSRPGPAAERQAVSRQFSRAGLLDV
jgi:hypothetical protein